MRLDSPIEVHDHTLGPDTANVTLVEYGDYQSASCAQAHAFVHSARSLLGERLRYVFRHFPIGQVHRHAQHAAEAAEAAGAQGRFWDMHEALASRQRPLDDASLLSWAHELGLDTSLFLRDVATHVHADYIGRQVQGGIDSGVESTPAFFINGVRFEDEWQHGDALLRALEEAAVT